MPLNFGKPAAPPEAAPPQDPNAAALDKIMASLDRIEAQLRSGKVEVEDESMEPGEVE